MLTRIDELTFPDHYHLEVTDECYFVGEYTARAGYNHSATNDLILNFKKEMDRRDFPLEWRHKTMAIARASAQLRKSINPDYLRVATFVPTPPSKSKDDPLYDDRVVQLLKQFGPDIDVRELVVQNESYEPSHSTNDRLSPEELYANYRIDDTLTQPAPQFLAVVDDVLTKGAHFKAMQRILSETFPGVPLLGLFVARCVPGAI
jgi:hypothetical protein